MRVFLVRVIPALRALTIIASLLAAFLWLRSARTPLANMDTIHAEMIEAARYSAGGAMAAAVAAFSQASDIIATWLLKR